ncbi:hypothetical protein DITRI_Ditri09bG0132200 [Diplodiscus trichospermus]
MAVGILEVLLVSAKGLKNTDFLGGMDPYVIIQYKGQERQSSVARVNGVGAGSCPSWNEKFTFKVEYPGAGGEHKLILKIMDNDTFSADDFIGQSTIYVEDLLATGAEKGNAELHPSKYSVVHADQTYCGEIQVGATFTLKVPSPHFHVEETTDEEEYGGWKESNF